MSSFRLPDEARFINIDKRQAGRIADYLWIGDYLICQLGDFPRLVDWSIWLVEQPTWIRHKATAACFSDQCAATSTEQIKHWSSGRSTYLALRNEHAHRVSMLIEHQAHAALSRLVVQYFEENNHG